MEFIKGAVFATLSFEQEQLDRSTVKSYMEKHVDMWNLIGLGCITIHLDACGCLTSMATFASHTESSSLLYHFAISD